jgi:elongation factor G
MRVCVCARAATVGAGKTTVTERILHVCGATSCIGNVDSGDTITDYLSIERERGVCAAHAHTRTQVGITINSAAVRVDWRGHTINIVDTPGHVDFTVEVERCVRVLDACVLVLDASRGVQVGTHSFASHISTQAQTRTVWRQLCNYKLPAVVFANKMDKACELLFVSIFEHG